MTLWVSLDVEGQPFPPWRSRSRSLRPRGLLDALSELFDVPPPAALVDALSAALDALLSARLCRPPPADPWSRRWPRAAQALGPLASQLPILAQPHLQEHEAGGQHEAQSNQDEREHLAKRAVEDHRGGSPGQGRGPLRRNCHYTYRH